MSNVDRHGSWKKRKDAIRNTKAKLCESMARMVAQKSTLHFWGFFSGPSLQNEPNGKIRAEINVSLLDAAHAGERNKIQLEVKLQSLS